ncbi:MAG TPA: hypothetical protein VMY37_08460 [Thermoguttaceae bacterium]|nr:hypothetical protein [Thermoguttaceae bacterium]
MERACPINASIEKAKGRQNRARKSTAACRTSASADGLSATSFSWWKAGAIQ